jgi:hypothetical protein
MTTGRVGCGFHTTQIRTRNYHLNPNSKAIRWQNNTPHPLGSDFSTQTCSKNMQKYNSNIRFWVSGASLSDLKPAPEISGVTRTRTQTQSTQVSPADSDAGAGGPTVLGVFAIPNHMCSFLLPLIIKLLIKTTCIHSYWQILYFLYNMQ